MSYQNQLIIKIFSYLAILIFNVDSIEDKTSSLVSIANISGDSKLSKIVCYWGSWSFHRQGEGKFSAENFDPTLCTHLIYAFAKLDADNKIASNDPALDLGSQNSSSGDVIFGHGMYKRVIELRQRNPNLKIMIAIGGWSEGSDKYSKMVSSESSRQNFVRSVSEFLKKYGFDGIDIDWEYPGYSASGNEGRIPGKIEDKDNFILLLRDLKAELNKSGSLLSIAVAANKKKIDRGYNVTEINKYVDFINVMTYNFHGKWDTKTGHNAPLFPIPGDTEKNKQFTVEYAIDFWLNSGADPSKLVMGIPFYGKTFTLQSPNEWEIGSNTIGNGGTPGLITNQYGYLNFVEICQRIREGEYQVYFNDTQKIKYAVKDNQWIGFDDVETINHKLTFLFNKNLTGAMVWSLNLDDFVGNCSGSKYPLLQAINHYGGELIKENCRPLWYKYCKENSECCTKYCDGRPAWEYGVCKDNGLTTKPSNPVFNETNRSTGQSIKIVAIRCLLVTSLLLFRLLKLDYI